MRNEEHSKVHCIVDTVAQSFHRGCKNNSTVSRLVTIYGKPTNIYKHFLATCNHITVLRLSLILLF